MSAASQIWCRKGLKVLQPSGIETQSRLLPQQGDEITHKTNDKYRENCSEYTTHHCNLSESVNHLTCASNRNKLD